MTPRFRDLSVLTSYYVELFGPRGLLLLMDRVARRLLPSALSQAVQRFLWLAKQQKRTTKKKGRIQKNHGVSCLLFVTSDLLDRKWFASHFPDVLEEKTHAAERIREHVFDFLGTGPVDWGDPIDWHHDVKSGYRWPVRFYTELQPVFNTTDTTDGKVPYELSRLHHFVTLGQVWWLSRDERYAEEFFAQWESWLSANPWPCGVNWTSAMEVAIRAVNLLCASALLAEAPGWTQERRKNFTSSLWQHGVYIEHNLEIGVRDGRLLATNHYLANICGLACLGLCRPELPDADRWRTVGLRALEQEIERQVPPDGFFYESSTAYHRLALELFLMPALLARRTGYEMSVRYWKRLEQMLEVILHLTRPDGRVPQIGDNDDGRLLILSRYPDWPRHDHRYLLALGAVLFHRGDFKAAALCPAKSWPERDRGRERGVGEECSHQEVFWLLGREAVEKFEALGPDATPLISRAFPDGGLYVMRSPDGLDYALVRAGSPAPHAPMAHAHNDALSLELWLDGQPVFVDSGTYCYTSDVAERNRFRSTMAHNTVMVDGQEINRIPPNEAFHLERDAQVKVVEWCVKANRAVLVADHNGYERLESPVCHRRKVQYNSAQHSWLIEEFLQGKGEHTVEVRWHFVPGVEHHVQPLQRGLTIAVGDLELLVSVADVDGWNYRVEPSWTSPSYGVKQNGVVLTLLAAFRDNCQLRVVGRRGVASPVLSPNLGAELPGSVDADRLKIKTKVG